MFDIQEKFFNEVFSVLFEDGAIKNLKSSGGGYSGNNYDFHIPPTEYFNLTKEYNPESNIISHFTSFRNLHSILNSEKIRLYNLLNMNDKTEYSYSIPEKYQGSEKGKREKLFILSGCDISKMRKSEIFKMWNDYGEKGFGVRLELEIQPQPFNRNVFLKNVLYRKFETSNLFKAKESFESKYSIGNIDLLETLIAPCILHKNEQNDLEYETRLVLYDSQFISNPVNCRKMNSPFFEEFSYESKKYCKYYDLKLNDPNEIAKVSINKIELGYAHKGEEKRREKLIFWCLAKQQNLGKIVVTHTDIENIYG